MLLVFQDSSNRRARVVVVAFRLATKFLSVQKEFYKMFQGCVLLVVLSLSQCGCLLLVLVLASRRFSLGFRKLFVRRTDVYGNQNQRLAVPGRTSIVDDIKIVKVLVQ